MQWFFFFLRMQLRPIVGQPGSSSIISRVKLGQTTVQLRKRAGFDDVVAGRHAAGRVTPVLAE